MFQIDPKWQDKIREYLGFVSSIIDPRLWDCRSIKAPRKQDASSGFEGIPVQTLTVAIILAFATLRCHAALFATTSAGFGTIEPVGAGALPRTLTLKFHQIGAGWGSQIIAPGDVDGDGLGDLVIGNAVSAASLSHETWWVVVPGGKSKLGNPIPIPRSTLADRLVSVGDMNGDKVADWGLVQSGTNGSVARVELYNGVQGVVEGRPQWTWQAPLGQWIVNATGVGDVTGDGLADLGIALAAPEGDHGLVLFFGSTNALASVPNLIIPPLQKGQSFGAGLAPAGDHSRSKRSDIVVGAPGATNRAGTRVGAVYVYRLLPDLTSTLVTWFGEGPWADSNFGITVAGGVDMDRDTWPEIVIGGPARVSGSRGGVWVYKGPGPAHQREGVWWQSMNQSVGEDFGAGVVVLPDMTGDQCGDFAIAAPGSQGAAENQGLVKIYGGRLGPPTDRPIMRISGCRAEGRFGEVLLCAGDLDGDGLSDLVIGSPRMDDPAVRAGRVDVIYGSATAFMEFVDLGTLHPSSVSAGVLPLLATQGVGFRHPIKPSTAWRVTGAWLVGLVALFAIGLAGGIAWRHQRAGWAVQQERLRLTRDLHDRVGSLVARLQHSGASPDNGVATALASEIDSVIWGLDPRRSSIEDFATFLADRVTNGLRGTEIRPAFDLPLELPALELSVNQRQQLESVISEAMANTMRHSHASEFRVRLRVNDGWLELQISDNGRGMNLAVETSGDGLRNLRQRLDTLGGDFEIVSQPSGGTCLRCRVPVGKALS